MRQYFNICSFYLLLLYLWMLNGIVFTAGSNFARGLIILIFLVSIYYTIYAIVNFKLPLCLRALSIFLIVFTIYGVFMLLDGKHYYVGSNLVSKTNYFVNLYLSLLPIYVFFVFTKTGYLNENSIKFYYLIFFILTIISFFGNQDRLLQIAIEEGISIDEVTNNIGYSFVGLLSGLVLFYKKPIIQYLLLIVSFYFIIIGMKRGAIITGTVCIIWFIISNVNKTSKRQKVLIVFLSTLLFIFGYFFIQHMMETSTYFQYRFDQTLSGDSSGRDVLYSVFLKHFINENNPLIFLFGNGIYATLAIQEQYAHNDWLEIAINQGLFGIIIYLVYWICFYITWRKTKQLQAFLAIGMFFIMYFLSSFFSMSYISVTSCSALILSYYLVLSEVSDK